MLIMLYSEGKRPGIPYASGYGQSAGIPLPKIRLLADDGEPVTTPCPTPCDEDCELNPGGCHERHAYRPDHDPGECEARRAALDEHSRLSAELEHGEPS